MSKIEIGNNVKQITVDIAFDTKFHRQRGSDSENENDSDVSHACWYDDSNVNIKTIFIDQNDSHSAKHTLEEQVSKLMKWLKYRFKHKKQVKINFVC